MRHRADKNAPLFDFALIDYTQLSEHSGALQAILEKRLDGIIVRNVLSAETVSTVVRRLEEDTSNRIKFPMFKELDDAPYTVGQAIVSASFDLVDYFRDAALQTARLNDLFSGQQEYQKQISGVFSALSGGLPTQVAHSPEGRAFTPSTVRVLPEGHEMGVHVGNEFARLPQARHLSGLIDMSDQISFFIPLSLPQGGGELVVYGVECDDLTIFLPKPQSADQGNVWLEGTDVFDVFQTLDSTAFAPRAGDMLIFDGGRYYHRVSKVEGSAPRRTIGGFVGFSKDHERLYYWS
jgi:hapalindole-type alkaloid chlorinase